MSRDALLYLCHMTESEYLRRFRTIERAFSSIGDTFFVFDGTHGEAVEQLAGTRQFVFTLDDLRRLGYSWLHDELMPGHVHFPVLAFSKAHPEYDFYWLVEYDVRLTGPWSWFFRYWRRSKADFLASHLASLRDQPNWHWWSSLEGGGIHEDPDTTLRFFGPIYRLSNSAMKALDLELSSGWRGHQEVVIPTILHHHGCTLEDLGREGPFGTRSLWSWYTKGSADPDGRLRQSTMRYRPEFKEPGLRPLTLYHPIKRATGDESGYFGRLVRRVGRRLFGAAEGRR